MRNSGLRTGTRRQAAVVTTAALCAIMALGLAPQPGHAQQANTTGSTVATPGGGTSGGTPADGTGAGTGATGNTGTTSTSTTASTAGASASSQPSQETAAPATADPSKVSTKTDDVQETKEAANGATDPQKAPLLVPGGAIDGKLYPKLFQDKFTDTATARGLLHWDVELKEDERLAFSYIVPPKQGIQRMDSTLQIIPFIIDQEGHNCVAQKSTDQEDNTNFAAPFTGYISSPRVGGQDQECKPGKFKVSLERRGAIEPSMELPFEFMLWKVPRTSEEPTAAASTNATLTTDDSPAVPLTMVDERKNAKLIGSGNYSGTLEPNKLQWFKVLVSEGQRLHVDVNASPIELERNADTSQPISLEWRVVGPTFNPVMTTGTTDNVPYDNVSVSSKQAVGIETVTNPIQWPNLEKEQGSGVGEFLSGEQWVALRYYRPQATANTQPLKFTISLAVSGTPLSVPKFVDNLTGQAATDAKRQEAVAEESQSKTSPRFMVRSNSTPGQLWTWAMVAAIVASIGAVGGVGILRGRGKEVSLFH